jgi:hypothetical protein
MPVNLSVKNVPDDIAAKLRARAATHHRSLQGELMAILQTVAQAKPSLTLDEIWALGQRLGQSGVAEAAEIVRQMRDDRHGH